MKPYIQIRGNVPEELAPFLLKLLIDGFTARPILFLTNPLYAIAWLVSLN